MLSFSMKNCNSRGISTTILILSSIIIQYFTHLYLRVYALCFYFAPSVDFQDLVVVVWSAHHYVLVFFVHEIWNLVQRSNYLHWSDVADYWLLCYCFDFELYQIIFLSFVNRWSTFEAYSWESDIDFDTIFISLRSGYQKISNFAIYFIFANLFILLFLAHFL